MESNQDLTSNADILLLMSLLNDPTTSMSTVRIPLGSESVGAEGRSALWVAPNAP